uniref:Multidrug-efflux transporter n=1 Tax=Candidatus Kentrum sp. FM TaxID=2126340 RepID=A0A450TCD4_9GAMM|nr:MAG: multidrug resistance protein, MATE family [Candidatus Kentron sp. FM]VFJ64924.1 MAG: multidrug resistance protein, MATE family [Candidatus Kentron sp. FM]VFK14081.1 MAG: multidrug resistance protein, MATE family [Candidatus Kentron sp. FM]
MSKYPTISELRDTLKLALPLAFGQLGVMTLGITDNLMLGRLGADALGAAGLALSIYNIIEYIGAGILFPVVVLASQAHGAGRSRTVPGIIRQGLWLSGILSVPACAILWNLEAILLATGQVPALARMAGHYMDYLLWTIFPAFAFSVFVFAFTVMGRAGTIAKVIWIAVGLNAILNYALIFGNFGFPAMGMAGAGLASVIVYASGHTVLFTLFAFHRFFRSGTVFRRAWRPKWGVLGQFLRLGWPKSLEFLMVSALFSVTALLVGRLGVQAIAAHTIAFEIAIVVLLGAVAVANAVTVRIGTVSVQEGHAGVWRVLNSSLLILFLFMLPPMVLLKLFSPWAVMLFVGSGLEAQTLLPIAAPVVVLAAFFVFVNGLRLVINQALNGLADMKVPALIAALCYWGITLPAGVVFGFVMELGVLGIWWGLIIGMSVAAVAYLVRFQWVVRLLCF